MWVAVEKTDNRNHRRERLFRKNRHAEQLGSPKFRQRVVGDQRRRLEDFKSRPAKRAFRDDLESV